MKAESTKYLRDLRRKIVDYFTLNELQILSFDLSVDWDRLEGPTIEQKTQALISYLNRRGELSTLVDLLREERPNVDWLSIPTNEDQLEIAFQELLAHYINLGKDLSLVDHLSERRRIWRIINNIELELREIQSKLPQEPQQSVHAARKKIFEEYYDVLIEEYTITNREISMALDPVTRLRLRRKSESLEEEILLIETQMSN